MARSEVILALTAMLMMNFIVISNSAPSGSGSVVPRDTDQISALREKLVRLNQLLSDVEEDEEADLKTVAGQEQEKESKGDIKTAISEYMGTGKQSEDKLAQKESSNKHDEAEDRSSGDDDSIRILSKALAKLRQPKYKSEDSTGEALSTLYNEPYVADKNTEEMENIIERALTRLSQEKEDDTLDQPLFGSSNKKYDISQEDRSSAYYDRGEGISRKNSQPTEEDNSLREEAIRVVEARLMQDIVLANKLGISVEDLIEDLDDKAFRDARLRKIEEELDSFQRNNVRY